MTQSLKKYAAAATSAASALALSATTVFADGVAISDVDAPGFFFADFGLLISAIMRFVVVVAALLVFFYLIWGGIEWITSGGDKGQTEKARNKITAAIIGLVILSAAVALFYLILSFFGIDGWSGLFDYIRE